MQDIPHMEVHQTVETPTLILYYFPECPYCFRVLEALKSTHLKIEMRNVRQNPEYRSYLKETVGKTQVPCLFIDDEPMHESMAIIQYLKSIS